MNGSARKVLVKAAASGVCCRAGGGGALCPVPGCAPWLAF